jgi:hypothetical protein
MVGQHGTCQEEEREMEDVHRFHRPQQGYTERQLPIAKDGLGCGLCGQRGSYVPAGLLLWLSSVLDGEGG